MEETGAAGPPAAAAETTIDAATIRALTNVLTGIQNVLSSLPAPGATAPSSTPLADLFDHANVLNLKDRAGLEAYNQSVKPLDVEWTGDVQDLPTFLLRLQHRASECKWTAANATGITRILSIPSPGGTPVQRDLFTQYHSITQSEVDAAHHGRTDPRSIQNAKAMYKCIERSVAGAARKTIFETPGNLPTNVDDGPGLFIKLIKLTAVSSTRLSTRAQASITSFCPSEFDFDIPTINQELNRLMVLATTPTRTFDQGERIQHTLNVYSAIKQPSKWESWVHEQQNKFDEGLLTNSLDFQNSATLKFNKIRDDDKEHKFRGSLQSASEEILAMIVKTASDKKRKSSPSPPADAPNTRPVKSDVLPLFVQDLKDSTGVPFKLGDTKLWNKKTWHFCDCPNHKDSAHWHTFKTEDCRTRKRWLKKKDEDSSVPASANLVDDTSTLSSVTGSTAKPSTPAVDASAMHAFLSKALESADNDAAREIIADAFNAVSDL